MRLLKYVKLIVFLLLVTPVLGQYTNIGPSGTATQSSTNDPGFASKAIDRVTDGAWGNSSVTHTQSEANSWWQLDLGMKQTVSYLQLWNRTDCCRNRLQFFYIFIGDSDMSTISPDELLTDPNVLSLTINDFPDPTEDYAINAEGRFVKIQLQGTGVLSLAEVQVFQSNNGKMFQEIDFQLPQKMTTDTDLPLIGSATSNLDVYFTVETGPATINGNTLEFTGSSGFVTILAFQDGDDMWNEAPVVRRTIEAINSDDVFPDIRMTSATEAYPLYMDELRPFTLRFAATIDHADIFSIESVSVNVNGTDYAAEVDQGSYALILDPKAYGAVNITATAMSAHGTSRQIDYALQIEPPTGDIFVKTFDKDLISFPNASRTYTSNYTLPAFVGSFSKITGFLRITCPPGGCDPFDRVAWIEVRRPGQPWIEIVRYITPFGVACNHDVDLTPFASLLQGDVELRMFIDTWAGGWEASLDIIYEMGSPTYPYSQVDVVWDGQYPFGNLANLQPMDTVAYQFHNNAEMAQMIMMTTGHGWGENNSQNAAEFRPSVHRIYANGEQVYLQVLNYICNPNPDGCQPQNGTWEFNRAGWCPGAIGQIHLFNLTDKISEGTIDMIYEFDKSYVDFCHPNNPNCVSGVTCPDCNAGSNPIYYVAGHVISYSNQNFDQSLPTGITNSHDEVATIHIYPNPATEKIFVESQKANITSIEINDVSGQSFWYKDYIGDQKKIEITIDNIPAGLYLAEIRTAQGKTTQKLTVH